MSKPVKYTRAIIAFVATLLVVLTALDAFIASRERKLYFSELTVQTQNEINLIGTFVTEPLLRQEFAIVEQFVLLWGERQPGVVGLRAYTPEGLLLVEYKRVAPAKDIFKIRNSVSFNDRHLLDLEIIKDLSPIISRFNSFQQDLIFRSLILTLVVAVLLWFILQVLALRPLELEYAKRVKAEKNLQKAHDKLEIRVAERTADLRQSKTTLENIFNNAIPLCISSVDFEVLLANEAYSALWPVTKDDKAPMKCFESRPGPYCHTESCPLTQIVQGKEEVVLETIKEDIDGSKLTFIITARPFRDADGKLIGIVESFQDITKRKQAEAALASERERLSVTLRSIGDGVITTDTGGRIVLVNKVAESLIGWTQDEAKDKNIEEVFRIINEKTRQPCANPVDKVMQSGGVIGLENHTALIARDGTERSIADSGAPIRDNESRIIGVVLVFRDVTEKKRMEEEIQKTRKLESVGVLAGGIAHDFNNILTAVIGNISLAKYKIKPGDEIKDLLEQAEKASLRAQLLTQQLLTFAKGGEPISELASIEQVIRESAGFVLRGSNVASTFDMPKDLWLASMDKGQISQVVQNVILNANESMPEGGTVEIRCENYNKTDKDSVPLPAGQYLKIDIQDQGPGIPPKIMDKIFDPYFTTKAKGNGLGLAICHSIIAKHDGHISARSEPDKGTVFTFFLPASKATEKKSIKKQIAIKGKQGKVLLMDDEEPVRDIAGKMLDRLGFEVVQAKHGSEALEKYKQAKADGTPIGLVILDLTIPGGMGGKETVKKILEFEPEAKVIVSSGYSNDPVMADYKEYGFQGAVAKPYQLQELVEVLNQVLN